MGALNNLYRTQPALHAGDIHGDGFEWIDCDDNAQSVISFMRFVPPASGEHVQEAYLFVCNFTPVPRHDYRMGTPWAGEWTEVLNSDDLAFGGSGVVNGAPLKAEAIPFHRREHSLSLTLPPLGVAVLHSVRPPAVEVEEALDSEDAAEMQDAALEGTEDAAD